MFIAYILARGRRYTFSRLRSVFRAIRWFRKEAFASCCRADHCRRASIPLFSNLSAVPVRRDLTATAGRNLRRARVPTLAERGVSRSRISDHTRNDRPSLIVFCRPALTRFNRRDVRRYSTIDRSIPTLPTILSSSAYQRFRAFGNIMKSIINYIISYCKGDCNKRTSYDLSK